MRILVSAMQISPPPHMSCLADLCRHVACDPDLHIPAILLRLLYPNALTSAHGMSYSIRLFQNHTKFNTLHEVSIPLCDIDWPNNNTKYFILIFAPQYAVVLSLEFCYNNLLCNMCVICVLYHVWKFDYFQIVLSVLTS